MRLRKQPWIEQSILQYQDIVLLNDLSARQGKWQRFFPQVQPIHLEIGTGRGSFIVGMAQKYPAFNFIGVETNIDVIYDVIMRIKKSPTPLPNIQLIRGDATSILDWFAPQEVSQIYLNFSDPWPKNRHAKRRLTHINFLNMYRQITTPTATVKQKTDNDSLFIFTLETLSEHNFKVLAVSTDLHSSEFDNPITTEYERRFARQGKNINYCEFRLH